MDMPTENNNAGPSNSYGNNIDTTNIRSTITLGRSGSKGKKNTTSEVVERNSEGSSLGKRKAAEGEDGSSTAGEKRRAAKKRKGKEIRAARYIKVCDDNTKQRIERAMKEAMYMIDSKEINPTHQKYSVLRATGGVFIVDIAKTVLCSCLDFQNGFHCKHILFILLRILKLDSKSKLIYQKALKKKELKFIFNNSPRIIYPSKGIVDRLKAIAKRDQNNRKPIDDDCLCCNEPLGNQEILIWCETCGKNIHQDCFTQWERSITVKQKVK
ncbi:hypothetical protein Glove_309g130 [Diversispora epigaea]|uniref:SWIM-type domain-containing protein n=1 Tax=Diversispora epigaea TaxID=1348612 RepID=A0A397HS90_9GLOM|nr:hypothetical protein Glove_309g130 [Diversispora epigaea]